ncbi:type VI secretion system-associated protein TagF [Burkholderia plantarii]|uniref:type VI secretion system-associated protein TagF n=1 Tax=Burkholderia plantarii TaxID=41899 RepID=UPI00272B55DD|nr:type VI secretion system-associated protein TagF [Burkholderia plantarii]
MSGGVGFHGKLPGAGDFVKRRLPADFIEGWDRHFQRAMETGRRELGERWAQAWRDGPAWRFVLPPQVCGRGAWCGLVGPALDRLGRAFPMVLAAPCTGDVARILGNAAWFDALERVYRCAQADAASVETFDARVAALPPPLAGGADLSARWRALPWDEGQWRLDMPGAAAAGVMLVEAWRQLCLRPGPWCLWWTAGATRLLATRGLPRSHAALLEPAGLAGAARDGDLADLFAGGDSRASASVDVQADTIRADGIGGEAGAGGMATRVANGGRLADVVAHASAPVDAAAATIRAGWPGDEASAGGTAKAVASGGRIATNMDSRLSALVDAMAATIRAGWLGGEAGADDMAKEVANGDRPASIVAHPSAPVDAMAATIRADWLDGEANAGGTAKTVANGALFTDIDPHASKPAPTATEAATIHADWLDDEAGIDGTVTDAGNGGPPAGRLHAALPSSASSLGEHRPHSTAMPASADPRAPAVHDESACALWLDHGRTLVLSADDDAFDTTSAPATTRIAARAIRATAAAHATDPAGLPGALLTLHARLRATARATTPPENGAALVARFSGASVHLLRFGAAAVWHWRRGVLQAPFVERAAGAGGEFDDLLFGDAWLAMPGIGSAGEPDRDAATLHLEAGDRVLLLATRALLRLPRECLADALALPTCDDASAHLARRAGLAAPSAHWPLAVLGVHA